MAPAFAPRFYACVTDVGRQRQGNEDSHAEFAMPDGGLLLVVCDGVGGHEAGEVASAVAVETIGRVFAQNPHGDPRERLYQCVLAANEAIIDEGARIGKRDMGTTAVVAYIRDREVYVAHVGDSRLYQFRAGEPVFRTRDHTRVQRMVDLGILTPQQAKEHPDANVIIRALGRRMTPEGMPLEPDVRANALVLEPGDAVLLCSDGLYDPLTDEDLWDCLSGRTAEESVRTLVDLANERGGPDNITATVLLYGQDRAPAVAAIPQTAPPVDALQGPSTGPSPGAPGATYPASTSSAAGGPGAVEAAKGSIKPAYLLAAGVALLLPVAFLLGRGSPVEPPPAPLATATTPDAGPASPTLEQETAPKGFAATNRVDAAADAGAQGPVDAGAQVDAGSTTAAVADAGAAGERAPVAAAPPNKEAPKKDEKAPARKDEEAAARPVEATKTEEKAADAKPAEPKPAAPGEDATPPARKAAGSP